MEYIFFKVLLKNYSNYNLWEYYASILEKCQFKIHIILIPEFQSGPKSFQSLTLKISDENNFFNFLLKNFDATISKNVDSK